MCVLKLCLLSYILVDRSPLVQLSHRYPRWPLGRVRLAMFLFEPLVLPAFGSLVLSSSYIRTRTIFPVCIVFCGFVLFLSHTYLPPSLGLTFFSPFHIFDGTLSTFSHACELSRFTYP